MIKYERINGTLTTKVDTTILNNTDLKRIPIE
jgi:hypothetical protein